MQGLQPRLLSRLKWGLQAELGAPDMETRRNILRQKLQNDGIAMSEEVVDYIAGNVTNNVRELEGAMISLMAQSSLNHKEITLDLAHEIVEKYVQSSQREITIDYIQRVKITKASLSVIGLQCGNKDHATVLHACKTIENLRQTDRNIRAMVEELEKKLSQ